MNEWRLQLIKYIMFLSCWNFSDRGALENLDGNPTPWCQCKQERWESDSPLLRTKDRMLLKSDLEVDDNGTLDNCKPHKLDLRLHITSSVATPPAQALQEHLLHPAVLMCPIRSHL